MFTLWRYCGKHWPQLSLHSFLLVWVITEMQAPVCDMLHWTVGKASATCRFQKLASNSWKPLFYWSYTASHSLPFAVFALCFWVFSNSLHCLTTLISMTSVLKWRDYSINSLMMLFFPLISVCPLTPQIHGLLKDYYCCSHTYMHKYVNTAHWVWLMPLVCTWLQDWPLSIG